MRCEILIYLLETPPEMRLQLQTYPSIRAESLQPFCGFLRKNSTSWPISRQTTTIQNIKKINSYVCEQASFNKTLRFEPSHNHERNQMENNDSLHHTTCLYLLAASCSNSTASSFLLPNILPNNPPFSFFSAFATSSSAVPSAIVESKFRVRAAGQPERSLPQSDSPRVSGIGLGRADRRVKD